LEKEARTDSLAQVTSPLTGSPAVTELTEIPTARLQRFYRDELGVDIDRFVDGLEHISLYRCDQTSYEFYWPPSLAGDRSFYDALSQQAWYYDPDRWEHQRAVEWLTGCASVLDVGCGSGAFLARIRERQPACRELGLELSPKAAAAARADGVNVQLRSLEQHVAENPGRFDAVTAFQVLEHVPDPRFFLESLVAAVRTDGLIVIGVPNNDGYIGEIQNLLSYGLNLPPHHMGLWRPTALEQLQTLFPVGLERLELEPLDRASRDRLAYGRLARALGDGKLAALAWRLHAHNVYSTLRARSLETAPGHTMLVAYRRRHQ
jgi:SAM-dependent methyltransferase